jgi:hypothetical protein
MDKLLRIIERHSRFPFTYKWSWSGGGEGGEEEVDDDDEEEHRTLGSASSTSYI